MAADPTSTNDAPADEAPAPVAFAIVGGGTPTPQQVAAIAVALTPVAVEEPAPTNAHGSAWREAALLEGAGFRPFVSVDDVERYHRTLA